MLEKTERGVVTLFNRSNMLHSCLVNSRGSHFLKWRTARNRVGCSIAYSRSKADPNTQNTRVVKNADKRDSYITRGRGYVQKLYNERSWIWCDIKYQITRVINNADKHIICITRGYG